MTAYIDKIDVLYRKMYAVAEEVLPENREGVTRYLREMWWGCFELTESFEYRCVSWSHPIRDAEWSRQSKRCRLPEDVRHVLDPLC